MNLPQARAGAQLLIQGDADGPASVARRFLAVQGQAFGPARWALGARSVTASSHDVDALFDNGTLVRTWTMRGTLHVVPAEDVRMMLTVTADKQRHLAAAVMRRDGVHEKMVSKAFDALESAMAEHGPLERKDAMGALNAAGVSTADGRGYHLIREAALAGIVVWGPVRGSQQALVPAVEWLPPTDAIGRDEALSRILVRYLECRAPATLRDFAWWLGITVAEARRAQVDAGDSVVPSDAGGEFLELQGAAMAPTQQTVTALLPAYDEYLLGYRDRSPVIDEDHGALVQAGSNGVFQPIVVVDGRVEGIWRAERQTDGLLVKLSPFRPLPSHTMAGLRRDAVRYAAYLGTPLLGVV